jgi:hypothetical protein
VRAGKLPVLRPVFRELGRPAAFVYQALEYAKGPQRSFDLVGATGLSLRAVYEALETIAAWDLVEPRDGRSARPNGSQTDRGRRVVPIPSTLHHRSSMRLKNSRA